MPAPALIAVVGVLVAVAATGTGGVRFVRAPGVAVAAWVVAVAALAVGLAAETAGFDAGFGPDTFRTVQIGAGLVAPLWLAWGLVESVAANAAVRFAAKLLTAMLTIVPVVVLATDPLSGARFSAAWPSVATYYQVVSHDVLSFVQAVAVVMAVIAAAAGTARAARRRPAVASAAVAAVCLAVLAAVAVRAPLRDGSAYAALGLVAAALALFGVGRAAVGRPTSPVRGDRGRRRRPPVPASRRPGRAVRPLTAGTVTPVLADAGLLVGDESGPGDGMDGGLAATPATADPGTAAPPAGPYGRIVVYTLLEDKVAEFDRLATLVADRVRHGEPDTLVYAVHSVPTAPLQRIFYEVYRDRQAFDRHESTSSVAQFTADRRRCVLATNVIELRLTHGRVSPLARTALPHRRQTTA